MRPRRLPKILTSEEQSRLLAQCNTRYHAPCRNLCIILMMLDCGLRAGEVVALRPEHIDMRTGKVVVREGKGARDREVYMSSRLRKRLAVWLDRRPASPWLFPTRDGGQIDTRYLRAMVKRYAKRAGVAEWQRVSPHTLRHTCATDLLNETGNIRLVQEVLGHASVSTTMIYTHVSSRQVRDAMTSFRDRRKE